MWFFAKSNKQAIKLKDEIATFASNKLFDVMLDSIK